MKRIYFIYIFSLITSFATAQTDNNFWFGLDGSYWQKSIKDGSNSEMENDKFSSIRPMIALKVSDKWDVGIMSSINSYEQQLNSFPFTYENPIIGEDGMVIGYNSRTDIYDVSIDNDLFAVGLFARRHFSLGAKPQSI